jgi:hypothetical protein
MWHEYIHSCYFLRTLLGGSRNILRCWRDYTSYFYKQTIAHQYISENYRRTHLNVTGSPPLNLPNNSQTGHFYVGEMKKEQSLTSICSWEAQMKIISDISVGVRWSDYFGVICIGMSDKFNLICSSSATDWRRNWKTWNNIPARSR